MTISPQATDAITEARSGPIPAAVLVLTDAQSGEYARSSRDFGRGVAFVLSQLREALSIDADRHWYVDQDGYCGACALPRANRRHVERAA